MKIAYLILAHKNPRHLQRLINALQYDNTAFFIHVDAKVNNLDEFKLFKSFDNVYFIKRRVDVQWGAFPKREMLVE